MKGEVVLSFFDKREVKEYLGLFTRNETVCFESWRISIVLLDAGGNDGIAALATGNVQQDKAAAYRSAYEQITNTMMSILEVRFLLLILLIFILPFQWICYTYRSIQTPLFMCNNTTLSLHFSGHEHSD